MILSVNNKPTWVAKDGKMEEESLIIQVEKHIILYNQASQYYKDLARKERAGRGVCTAVGFSGKVHTAQQFPLEKLALLTSSHVMAVHTVNGNHVTKGKGKYCIHILAFLREIIMLK